MSTLNDFIDAYIETALWSSHQYDEDGNDEGNLDDEFGPEDLAPSTKAAVRRDCSGFLEMVEEAGLLEEIEEDITRAGADFWLTRNRHGAGFWDGDWEHGDELTKIAHSFGSEDWYAHDGLVYQSGDEKYVPRAGEGVDGINGLSGLQRALGFKR